MCDVCNMVSTYMLGTEYLNIFPELAVFYHTRLEYQNTFYAKKKVSNFTKRYQNHNFE